MKTHKRVYREGPFGGMVTTSLCRRLNSACADGMNISDRDDEVTCAFCLRMLEARNARKKVKT